MQRPLGKDMRRMSGKKRIWIFYEPFFFHFSTCFYFRCLACLGESICCFSSLLTLMVRVQVGIICAFIVSHTDWLCQFSHTHHIGVWEGKWNFLIFNFMKNITIGDASVWQAVKRRWCFHTKPLQTIQAAFQPSLCPRYFLVYVELLWSPVQMQHRVNFKIIVN